MTATHSGFLCHSTYLSHYYGAVLRVDKQEVGRRYSQVEAVDVNCQLKV